jgi:antitoxin VapB
MGLNIKTDEAHRLAKKIAERTGESLSTAVTTALKERLERIEKKGRLEQAWAIAEDMARRLKGPGPTMMDVDDLYDEETGLPK